MIEKRIALTFDDGPDDETSNILDVLKNHGVKATFFCMGKRIREHPEVVVRAYEEGHQIANHTYTHPHLQKIDKKKARKELEQTNCAIRDAIKETPRYFRAPYGEHGCPKDELFVTIDDVARDLNLSEHIHWDINTEDYCAFTKVDDIVKAMMSSDDGDIILCHDGRDIDPRKPGVCKDRKNTTEAADKAIPILKKRGFSFVKVSEPGMHTGRALKLPSCPGVERTLNWFYTFGKLIRNH